MMQNSKFMRIFLIVGSVLIIVGVSLTTWMLATEDDRNVIRVQIDEGDSTPVKFEALTMVPGDEYEYSVKLVKDRSDKFDLKFDFVETGDGTLKNYARVKIIVHDNVVYDDLLVNTLGNNNILLSVDFNEDKNTEFQIVYYLPVDVGNEAKNAEALFGLILTASNE
jgi:hypothetical protein